MLSPVLTVPLAADEIPACIIDLAEGDPVWGKPLFVYGADNDDTALGRLKEQFGIREEDQVEVLEPVEYEEARLNASKDINDVRMGVLIQNQAPGHGLDIQLMNEDNITFFPLPRYKLVAYMAGFKDAKIVIASPVYQTGGASAVAEIIKAAEYGKRPFTRQLKALSSDFIQLLKSLNYHLTAKNIGLDGFDEKFTAALDGMVDRMIAMRDAGERFTEARVNAAVDETFGSEDLFPTPVEDYFREKLVKYFVRWGNSDLGDDARNVYDIEQEDARWDRPVFAYGDDNSENAVETMLERLGIRPEQVDLLPITKEDLKRLVGEDSSGPMSSSILMQNLPKGSGIQVQIFEPGSITEVTSQQYAQAALSLGVEDIALVIITRTSALGTSALAGLYKTLELYGLGHEKENFEQAQEQLKTSSEITSEARKVSGYDAELFDQCLKAIARAIESAVKKGPVSDDAIREIMDETIDDFGQAPYFTDETKEKLFEQMQALRDRLAEEGAAPADEAAEDETPTDGTDDEFLDDPVPEDVPVLVHDEDISEKELKKLKKELGLRDKDEVEVVPVNIGDLEDLVGEELDDEEVATIFIEQREKGEGVEVIILGPGSLPISVIHYENLVINLGLRDVRITIVCPGDCQPQNPLIAILVGQRRHGIRITQKQYRLVREELELNVKLEAEVLEITDGDESGAEHLNAALRWIKESLISQQERGHKMSWCRVLITVEDMLHGFFVPEELRLIYTELLTAYYFEWIHGGVNVVVEQNPESVISEDLEDAVWGRPVFAYGEDLSADELALVREKFKLADAAEVHEIAISGDDVREVLDVDVDNINMFSSLMIQNLPPGSGINVQILTPDLIQEVTRQQYETAVLTFGLTDVNVAVATPRPATGQAALTGIYFAYEALGGAPEDDIEAKLKLAFEELLLLSKIANSLDTESEAIGVSAFDTAMLDVKEGLIRLSRGGLEYSEATVEELIERALEAYRIGDALSAEQLAELVAFYLDWLAQQTR